MLTVPQAARRTGKNPETIRRWIRAGRLRSTKVGTQHMIEEADLEAVKAPSNMAELPEKWRYTSWGDPMPDVVALLDEVRRGR